MLGLRGSLLLHVISRNITQSGVVVLLAGIELATY